MIHATARDDLTISCPQLGKSIAGALWLLTAGWMRGESQNPSWWVAPTYNICRIGFVDRLCYMAQQAGILHSATTSAPFRATLTNGHKFEGRSWDDPLGLAGQTIERAVIDEFGQMTTDAYRQISARRLETVPQGFGQFRWLGNVGEVGGEAETIWNMAEKAEPGFSS